MARTHPNRSSRWWINPPPRNEGVIDKRSTHYSQGRRYAATDVRRCPLSLRRDFQQGEKGPSGHRMSPPRQLSRAHRTLEWGNCRPSACCRTLSIQAQSSQLIIGMRGFCKESPWVALIHATRKALIIVWYHICVARIGPWTRPVNGINKTLCDQYLPVHLSSISMKQSSESLPQARERTKLKTNGGGATSCP